MHCLRLHFTLTIQALDPAAEQRQCTKKCYENDRTCHLRSMVSAMRMLSSGLKVCFYTHNMQAVTASSRTADD